MDNHQDVSFLFLFYIKYIFSVAIWNLKCRNQRLIQGFWLNLTLIYLFNFFIRRPTFSLSSFRYNFFRYLIPTLNIILWFIPRYCGNNNGKFKTHNMTIIIYNSCRLGFRIWNRNTRLRIIYVYLTIIYSTRSCTGTSNKQEVTRAYPNFITVGGVLASSFHPIYHEGSIEYINTLSHFP